MERTLPEPLRAAVAERLPPALRLLAASLHAGPARFALRTGTRVDTGLWWRRRRAWLVGFDDRLALLADGLVPFLDAREFEGLAHSAYNHVTGTLLLAPNAGLMPAVRLPVAAAYAVLEFVGAEMEAEVGAPRRAAGTESTGEKAC